MHGEPGTDAYTSKVDMSGLGIARWGNRRLKAQGGPGVSGGRYQLSQWLKPAASGGDVNGAKREVPIVRPAGWPETSTIIIREGPMGEPQRDRETRETLQLTRCSAEEIDHAIKDDRNA